MSELTSLAYIIRRRSQLTPEKVALVFESTTWTYGRLHTKVERFAAALHGRGVKPGDRIAYLGFNHARFVFCLFATRRLGVTFVPLNFRLTAPELAYIIDDADATVVVYESEFETVVAEVRAEVSSADYLVASGPGSTPSLESISDRAESLSPTADVGAADVALLMYTSGTTGHPKGVMLTDGNLFWNDINNMTMNDFGGDERTLVCVPLFHIGGIMSTLLPTLVKGGAVVIRKGFDAGEALADIESHRITSTFLVPAMLRFVSQHPTFATADLSSLRLLIVGGEPVEESLLRLCFERGLLVSQGYGLTEAAPMVTFVPSHRAIEKLGSIGVPHFYCDARIGDEKGREVPVGEPGEVLARGPNVMKGYWRRPQETEAAFINGWLRTGDIGYMDSEGYFYLIDRKKDMVISGGENVYPAEVENVIYEHPAVAEVAVIGLPDARWGESVRAVVVLRSGHAATAEALIAFCEGRLARYKLPRSIVFAESLPRNASGKVQKKVLRSIYGETDTSTATASAQK